MRLAFYRINKEEKFTQIDNRMINDPGLSAKAKGILLYLLSKPSDWKVYEIDIVNNMKDGRDSIRSGISELIKNGYIEREMASGEKGKFAGYNYNVYEHNSENPCWKTRVGKPDVGKTDNGKPDVGKSNTTNTNITNINSNNTELNKTKTTTEQSSASNSFKLYEQNIGPLTPMMGEELGYLIDEHSEELVLEAIKETVRNNGKSIKYVTAILRNWHKENIKSVHDLQMRNERNEKHGKNQHQVTKQYDDGVNF